MVGNVVLKTGATVRVRGMMYKATVQLMLLYGSGRWVVTRAMLKVIEGFCHRAERSIARKTARRTATGKCEWPPLAEALENAGLCPIKEYIQQIQDTVAAQVACRSIYYLCTGEERIPGTSRFMKWWEQDVGWEVE